MVGFFFKGGLCAVNFFVGDFVTIKGGLCTVNFFAGDFVTMVFFAVIISSLSLPHSRLYCAIVTDEREREE